MRVNGLEDFLVCGFQILCQAKFGNHLSGVSTNNMGSQQLAILGIEDQLD